MVDHPRWRRLYPVVDVNAQLHACVLDIHDFRKRDWMKTGYPIHDWRSGVIGRGLDCWLSISVGIIFMYIA